MADQNKTIAALTAAGIDVNKLPEAQRRVMENLSQEEVKTLVAIKQRLGEGSDVQGYQRAADDTGWVIY